MERHRPDPAHHLHHLDAATIKGSFTGGVAAGTTVAFTADGHTLVTVIGSAKATAWDIAQ